MRWRLRPVVFLLLVSGGAVSAHQTTPDPTVEVTLTRVGGRLVVDLRLPIAVLADANLPRTAEGRLARDQIGPALDLVARGLAHDLDVQQRQTALAASVVSSQLSPDDASVEVRIEYGIRADVSGLSARLRPFRAGGQTVATTATYVDQRARRTYTIDTDTERVIFDPSVSQVLGRFVRRAAGMLFDGGDYLLFALCLMAPLRYRDVLMRAVIAYLAGQLVSAGVVGGGAITLSLTSLLIIQAIGASTIVITAIQSIVAANSRWVPAAALEFGVANGISVGYAFAKESSFAGSHLAAGLGAWLVLTEFGHMWALLLLTSAAGLVRRRGATAQLALLAIVFFAGHAALHTVVDRAQLLADLGAVTLDRFLAVLTIAWAMVVLCAGIVGTMWSRGAGSVAPTVVADIAGTGQ